MKGMVETSLNMATIKSKNGKINVLFLIRSAIDSAMEDVESSLESLFRLAGAEVDFPNKYNGWKPNPDSEILNLMKDIYQTNFGVTPEIKGIHAGLECGILSGAYPNWDMISFGPTIRFPHSPDEKVNIETVEKFWNFLTKTLESIPEK